VRERLEKVARRFLVPAFVVASLASALGGTLEIWPELGSERDRWADAADREISRAAAREAGVSPAVFEFFAVRLRAGDRFYVNTPRGEQLPLTDEGGIVRMYAGYALLPAVQTLDPAGADVVLSYRADPQALEVEVERIERYAGRVEASVARVVR
jgi:hypothetical protein